MSTLTQRVADLERRVADLEGKRVDPPRVDPPRTGGRAQATCRFCGLTITDLDTSGAHPWWIHYGETGGWDYRCPGGYQRHDAT